MNRHYPFWPKGLPYHLSIPETTVHDNLAVTARRFPERVAINYYGNPITYRSLWAQVEALAGYLQVELGVKRGDRVGLYLQNSPQYIIAYYAILRVDAVVVPINPMNRSGELRFYLQDSGATVLIVGQELQDYILPVHDVIDHVIVVAYRTYIADDTTFRLPDVVQAEVKAIPAEIQEKTVHFEDALNQQLTASESVATPDDLAVLPYTSGTTGIAKGCMHTHRTTQANIVGGATWSQLTSGSVVLCTLPLFHVTGMEHSMNVPIFTGATTVLMTRWERDLAATLIETYRCTHWKCIATMLIDFLNHPNLKEHDLSSLIYLGGGGASIPAAIAQKCKRLLGIDYIEGYGLSETISTSHVNPDHRAKGQCAGIPTFDVDARIVHSDTLQPLNAMETGEIVIHGPQVFQGYWNRPEENQEAFIEIDGKSFFRTGDIGYYDEEGYFFIVDRVKRMINAAGFKVWPTEIEAFLYEHPAVSQACVIGVPDERRGQTVKALIVLHPDAVEQVTPEDIIEWSKGQMAAYKYPRIVEFVDQLPMSGSGKILWRQLQEEATKNAGGVTHGF